MSLDLFSSPDALAILQHLEDSLGQDVGVEPGVNRGALGSRSGGGNSSTAAGRNTP